MGYLSRIHRGENAIDFPRLWRPAIAVSALLVLLGILSFFTRGINWSIEFEGGTLWEVKSPGTSVSAESCAAAVRPGSESSKISMRRVGRKIGGV